MLCLNERSSIDLRTNTQVHMMPLRRAGDLSVIFQVKNLELDKITNGFISIE